MNSTMHSPCLSAPPAPRFQILVVSADVARAMDALEAARAWPTKVAIDWVSSWHEAMRRARELRAQLVIVDCSAGTADSAALVRHLTRLIDGIEVIAFADRADQPATSRISAWPWSALPEVLGEWLDLQTKLRTAPSGPAA